MRAHTVLAWIFVTAVHLRLCQGAARWSGRGRSLIGSREPWIEAVSTTPRAYVYHNFLSAEEADHIVTLARPFMKRSTVVGGEGPGVIDDIRTSYGCFLKRLQDPVIERIEERVARWTHLNMSHQEDMQILRYGHGQKYGDHWDTLDYDGAPRVATVLLYLSDVEEGGETAFPHSEWLDPSLPARLGPFGPCAKGHVAVKPRKGDALLFFSLHPDGKQDSHSLHTGCPVIKGIKWTATKWIHTKPFRPESLGEPADEPIFPEDCSDDHPNCKTWAAEGECEKNPSFMISGDSTLGKCRLSCGACDVCSPDDIACKSRNRQRLGYLPLEELLADS